MTCLGKGLEKIKFICGFVCFLIVLANPATAEQFKQIKFAFVGFHQQHVELAINSEASFSGFLVIPESNDSVELSVIVLMKVRLGENDFDIQIDDEIHSGSFVVSTDSKTGYIDQTVREYIQISDSSLLLLD